MTSEERKLNTHINTVRGGGGGGRGGKEEEVEVYYLQPVSNTRRRLLHT